MSKHIANKKQELAFNSLIKAFKEAKKTGLVIYAKSEKLVAYTKQADDYVKNEHGFEKCLSSYGGQIPYLSCSLLADSGADDYPSYIDKADAEKFNPDNF